MLAGPIHVLDFEGSRESGVVEYGLATVAQGRIVDTATRICAPSGAMSAMEVRQHGIEATRAAGERPFAEEWGRFSALRSSGPFCAHNAVVEEGFLRAVWPQPRRSPDFSREGASTTTWGPWLDTLHLYRRIYGQLQSYKLEDLITVFALGERLEAAARRFCPEERRRYHCALYDALASALLICRLGEEPSLRAGSLHWLFAQSAASEAGRAAMTQRELL